MVKRRFLAPLALALVACAGTSTNVSQPPDHGEDEWTAARAIAEAHVTALGGDREVRQRYERVPFLFRAYTEQGTVLVHGGSVVEERGLEALGAYLRDISLLETRHLEASDFRVLIQHFGAYPPVGGKYGLKPYIHDVHEDNLGIERGGIRWREDRGEYTVFYQLGRHYAQAGAPRYTPLRKVSQWTLVIPESYELRWEETLWSYDIETHEFAGELPGQE